MDLKKSRTIFNPHQLSFLEEYYSDNPFPKTKERQQIADQLGIHLLHVKVCEYTQKIIHRNIFTLIFLGMVSEQASQGKEETEETSSSTLKDICS